MNWLVLQKKYKTLIATSPAQQIFELGLSLLIGLLVGAIVVLSWRFSAGVQGIVFLVPIGFMAFMLINDLEKTVLAAIAISVPLSLDFSLIISPYARNAENIAHGNLTIVSLTELRISLVLLVLILGYAIWILEAGRMGVRRPRFFSATTIPSLGFFFVSMLSIYQAKDLQLSFFGMVQLLEFLLTYFYLANHLRTRQEILFFVQALMGGMLAENLLMILQWITGLHFWFAGIDATLYTDPVRVGGTFGNPNIAGGVISGFLALVCAMIWVFPKRSQKVFALLCFVTGCAALISTSSRASWVGFLVAFLIFSWIGFWRGWVNRKTLVWMLIGTTIIVLIFYPTIYSRITLDDSGSAESRVKMARLAWNVIRAHPWLGVGTNNYALVAADYNTADVGYLGYIIYSAVHNKYLLTWAETGLFGLLFYIAFLIAPIIEIWHHVRRGGRFQSLVGLGAGCAIASMSMQMLAEHFNLRTSMLFVWILVALATSLRNLESVNPESLPQV
ncbi:MAG: O-antigen ligase family protein [Anaerolineales bacterium]|nr:O-antigen ligase family protein [Anaerolineales bacterium]